MYRLESGLIQYLLVTQQAKPDRWILPQGHQRAGETLEQTARRETLEESGCEVKIGEKLGSFTVFSNGKEWLTSIFLARLISSGPNRESREISWRSIKELDGIAVYPESRQLLQDAQRLLDDRIRKADQAAKSLLGQMVVVTVNRPIGTEHAGIRYRTNYGYIEGVIGKDGDLLDAYILGVDRPLSSFEGKCIAIIKRVNDLDDKLIVVPQETRLDLETIKNETSFVEKFFESELIPMPGNTAN